MKEFTYKARDPKGGLVEGVLRAETPEDVRRKLDEMGLFPIVVKSTGGELALKFKEAFKPKVKLQELVLFTKQFHTLFKAGMGMETLLTTLAKQAKNPTLSEALEKIRGDIQQGNTLAQAFRRHPKIFNDLYVNLIASGEEAGILDEVLAQLSDLLEKEIAIQKGISSALLYPKIVLGVMVLASAVLLVFVIPKFENFFAKFGADLPLPTKVMIFLSDFVLSYYVIFLIMGVVSIVFTFKRYYATPKGRYNVDKLWLKVPVFGPLSLQVCNARFANILSILYKSGMPVTRALQITADTIGNEAFMRDVKSLQADVERGGSMADSMKGLHYFSDVIIEGTNVGERFGSLDDMLQSIGGHYEMEINYTVKNLSTLLEPMMLLVIFGMVTGFALAILLPMWGMTQAALGKS